MSLKFCWFRGHHAPLRLRVFLWKWDHLEWGEISRADGMTEGFLCKVWRTESAFPGRAPALTWEVGLRSGWAAWLIPLPSCTVSFFESDNVCLQYLWWNFVMTAGLTLTSLPVMPFWTVMDTLVRVARTLLSALFAAGAYLTLLHALLCPLTSWVLLISSSGWGVMKYWRQYSPNQGGISSYIIINGFFSISLQSSVKLMNSGQFN